MLIIEWKLKREKQTKISGGLTKDTIFCHYKTKKGNFRIQREGFSNLILTLPHKRA